MPIAAIDKIRRWDGISVNSVLFMSISGVSRVRFKNCKQRTTLAKQYITRCYLYYGTLLSTFKIINIIGKLQTQNINFNSQFAASDYMLLLETP
jgi:hypothetical protein